MSIVSLFIRPPELPLYNDSRGLGSRPQLADCGPSEYNSGLQRR
ncbi:MAG TPA: hypothetical protein VJU53_04195 [Burkholderiaceae bacterium]|nr:hypothetical protein [Burkholderiaceae bacterium]